MLVIDVRCWVGPVCVSRFVVVCMIFIRAACVSPPHLRTCGFDRLEARRVFWGIDEDNSGEIDASELRAALLQLGLRTTPKEVRTIVRRLCRELDPTRELHCNSQPQLPTPTPNPNSQPQLPPLFRFPTSFVTLTTTTTAPST